MFVWVAGIWFVAILFLSKFINESYNHNKKQLIVNSVFSFLMIIGLIETLINSDAVWNYYVLVLFLIAGIVMTVRSWRILRAEEI
ncbi:hypothetical protein ACKXGF_13310 [Alkalibacillus sp. S2W]|uniref:hypothetical protein n=1 Tax=Alkalibacillus sp. S2W TaxID=3386553 RepID=UPI00398CED2B